MAAPAAKMNLLDPTKINGRRPSEVPEAVAALERRVVELCARNRSWKLTTLDSSCDLEREALGGLSHDTTTTSHRHGQQMRPA